MVSDFLDIGFVDKEVLQVVYLVGVLVIVFIVWLLFYRKLNYVEDYTAFGYQNGKGRNEEKKLLVNLALKRRKLGELPPPYPNSWFAILESDELQRGEVKEVYVLGRNLVAWRGKIDGKAYVSDAYCPHLGAHLGVGGTVIGDCIECPFHKWSFDGSTGKTANIPYSSSFLDNNSSVSSAKLAGLKTWQVVETNGFIFIWHHVHGEDPTWYPEGIQDAVTGKWKYHGRTEFQATCHIQEIPENGADVAHLNALHDAPALFGERFSFLTNLLSKFVKHNWSADWSVNEEPNRGHESVGKMHHHLTLLSDRIHFLYVDVLVKQIGAGIVVITFSTLFGRGVMFQSVTPIEPLLQKITHRFYSESRLFHPFALLILRGEAIQISRDIAIWNRKCFLKQPMLVKEDCKIRQFRRWFSQFYSSGVHDLSYA